MWCLETLRLVNENAVRLARQGQPEHLALAVSGIDLGTEKPKGVPVLSAKEPPIQCPLCGLDVNEPECDHSDEEWAAYRTRQTSSVARWADYAARQVG